MRAFDPRLTPARADLAARALEGKVAAARYVDGRVCEVIDPQAPLRGEPAPDAPLLTEALKGERVTIYDTNAEGWAWGQLASDGYVGWLPANALAPAGAPPTHNETFTGSHSAGFALLCAVRVWDLDVPRSRWVAWRIENSWTRAPIRVPAPTFDT